jgi:diadenylate cyclase
VFEGLKHLVSLNRPLTDILRDLFDLFVVAFIFYRALLVLKGTRAMQMGIGFVAFGVLYLAAKYAELATLMSMLSWLAAQGILIVVVVFQNDIRRALIRVGSRWWMQRARDAQEKVIDEVVASATELARHRMGALIVLERDANVLEFIKNDGIPLDSVVTHELLVSLFIPESINKLHDGAVLIRDLRIARAGVFLPMPEATRIADSSLGSRHRAAIGLTEETDAVVVVVSEERGTITLCFPNGMVPNLPGAELRNALLGLFGRTSKKKEPVVVEKAAPSTVRATKTSAGALKLERSGSITLTGTGQMKIGASPSMAGKVTAQPSAGGKTPQNPPSVRPPPVAPSPPTTVRLTPVTSGVRVEGDEETIPPTPARVSVPMPSPRDRQKGDIPPPPESEAGETPHAGASGVSKPMAPTELPATTLPEDQ